MLQFQPEMVLYLPCGGTLVKYRYFFLSAMVIVGLLSSSVCGMSAKAPATAKIAFSSWRGGNLDIYLMNPDGSEEVRLTRHLLKQE